MRIKSLLRTSLFLIFSASGVACAGEGTKQSFSWPNGAKAAVNLAYDDALDSQLDNVIPALDKYGFKGSFYVPGGAPVLTSRLPEWRAAAKNGHELGNHSIFHQCSASKPGREWVPPHNDLDKMTADQMAAQVAVANNILYMIDGKNERTYTAPCGDLEAGGENYIDQVKQHFVGIKAAPGGGVAADMNKLDPHFVGVTVPVDMTGEQLIAIVEEAAAKGTMANLTFHGVGGDYLSVSKDAHEQLLAHLAKHPDVYYVDTFLNIMKHVKQERGLK